jgi:hypothetical protein
VTFFAAAMNRHPRALMICVLLVWVALISVAGLANSLSYSLTI